MKKLLNIFCLLLTSVTVIVNGISCPFSNIKSKIHKSSDPHESTPACTEFDQRYRSITGFCNNLENPFMGSTGEPFKRLLPPVFGNNISSPRIISQFSNQYLPNPRSISVTLLQDNNKQFEEKTSNLLAHFGQFLAHDVTKFEEHLDEQGNSIRCECDNDNEFCFQIIVPCDDPVLKQPCIRFTRAEFKPGATPNDHVLHPNTISGLLDGSVIYGSTIQESRNLRAFFGGRLSISRFDQLQENDAPSGGVCDARGELFCFLGGDVRASEVLMLSSVHLTFVREHNRIAKELYAMNSHWNDELIYQEARKINIAQFVHIVYNEWLPIVTGDESLIPLKNGFSTPGRDYDPRVEPQIAIEVASSAFRFGHSLIRNNVQRFDYNNLPGNKLNLSELIFDSTQAYIPGLGETRDGISEITIGMINQPCSQFDSGMVDTIRNQLFEFMDSRGTQTPVDLGSLNIQRGRDFAQRGYTDYVEHCHLGKIHSFIDLFNLKLMTYEKVIRLKSVYANVHDIDLFVGGLHETPRNGALIGPTFACMMRDQFETYRKGDRFYYEHGPSTATFSLPQLQEIRKTSIARLLCDSQGAVNIQPKAFMLPLKSIENERVNCDNIPSLDLNLWKDINQLGENY